MKKLLKRILVIATAALMLVTLVSCGGPATDPEDAKAALEDNGYEVILVDGTAVEVTAGLLGVEDLDASLTAFADDNAIMIYYFESKEAAEKAWEKIEDEAEKAKKEYEEEKDEDDPDFVIKKSGAMIYFGTADAVKAAK